MMTFDDSGIIETPVSSERVFDGMALHIDHLKNRLPNGTLAGREVARMVGAAAVIPVDADGGVYLERQYRVPFDKVLWEIPAGKLNYAGEDRLEAAKRELSEETGLTAEKWTHLIDMYTSVGYIDECIGIYMAEGLQAGETHPDEDEFLRVVKVPLNEAADMVTRGEIRDSKTVCAILMAKDILKK